MDPQAMPVEPADPEHGGQVRAIMRRRHILTGGLVAGLVVALGFAGVVYWLNGFAVGKSSLADRIEREAQDQSDGASERLKRSHLAAERVISDISQTLRNARGKPKDAVLEILETSRTTFDQLAD